MNGIVLGYLYPLTLQIYWSSIVTPAYNLGPRNTASLNTYSNLNWPNSLPIKFSSIGLSVKALSVSM